MLVGAHLKQARIRAGLTSERVALLLDSYHEVVSRTESGEHVPELRGLLRHWFLVGLSIEQLGAILDACVYRAEGGEGTLID